MKIGDRVVRDGFSETVWVIERLNSDKSIATIKNIYEPSRIRDERVSDLTPTQKNPVILVEALGDEWKQNVLNALEKTKIKYKIGGDPSRRDMTRFFVDAKKLKAAKACLDEYYKNLGA